MPLTPESLVWAQEQSHGDAELAVCKGHFPSLGDPVWWPDGCVSGNAILTGALPLVRPFFLAFFMIHLSVSETETTTELASGVTSTLTG